jgi:hypothetical protein
MTPIEEARSKTYKIVIPEEERWKIPLKGDRPVHGDTYCYNGVRGKVVCGISKDAVYLRPLNGSLGDYIGVPIAWLELVEEENA